MQGQAGLPSLAYSIRVAGCEGQAAAAKVPQGAEPAPYLPLTPSQHPSLPGIPKPTPNPIPNPLCCRTSSLPWASKAPVAAGCPPLWTESLAGGTPLAAVPAHPSITPSGWAAQKNGSVEDAAHPRLGFDFCVV